MYTSLTSSALIPALCMAPLMATDPSCGAVRDAKEPRKEVIGVLAAETMTTSSVSLVEDKDKPRTAVLRQALSTRRLDSNRLVMTSCDKMDQDVEIDKILQLSKWQLVG